MSRGYRGGSGFVGPPAEAGGPGSHGHCVDDTFDLLDVLPFMASQPLRIEQHGPLEDLSRPRNSRRSFPAFGRQRFENCQEIGTLRGKGAQRGPEFPFEIVRLLDPGAGIDSPQHRRVLGDHCHTRYDRSSERWSSYRTSSIAPMCCAICSQTRRQFAVNLITSYLMVDDKEKNGEPILALFFGTDNPRSRHK